MSDQLGSLDFRMDSKLSLLSEFQEFFKRRGEVEYEYARSLERLCEKFERNTKQRNIKLGGRREDGREGRWRRKEENLSLT